MSFQQFVPEGLTDLSQEGLEWSGGGDLTVFSLVSVHERWVMWLGKDNQYVVSGGAAVIPLNCVFLFWVLVHKCSRWY